MLPHVILSIISLIGIIVIIVVAFVIIIAFSVGATENAAGFSIVELIIILLIFSPFLGMNIYKKIMSFLSSPFHSIILIFKFRSNLLTVLVWHFTAVVYSLYQQIKQVNERYPGVVYYARA